MRRPRLIIIGCGRAGTMFTARMLQDSGLPHFKHEKLGDDGGVGWTLTLPGYRHRWRACDTILHQVREPWACVSSMTTHARGLYVKTQKIVGRYTDLDNVALCAAEWWLRHNAMCAGLAEWTYRIEDVWKGTSAAATLRDYAGVTRLWFPPRDTNDRAHRMVNAGELPKHLVDEINALAGAWGY